MLSDSSSVIDPNAEDGLKDIFGFLEKSFLDGASSDSVPPELRQQMERFAEGQIPVGEIEALSTQILHSPELIRAFAQILHRS